MACFSRIKSTPAVQASIICLTILAGLLYCCLSFANSFKSARPKISTTATCTSLMARSPIASRIALATAAGPLIPDYEDYRRWVAQEFSDYQTCEHCVFGLELQYENLGLSDDELSRQSGPALIAGEGEGPSGNMYQAIADQLGEQNTYALDLSYKGVSGTYKNFIEGSVTRMPFQSNSFGFVVAHMVAHYLRDYSEIEGDYGMNGNHQGIFVKEVIRILKPGGEARLGPLPRHEMQSLLGIAIGEGVHAELIPAPSGRFSLKINK